MVTTTESIVAGVYLTVGTLYMLYVLSWCYRYYVEILSKTVKARFSSSARRSGSMCMVISLFSLIAVFHVVHEHGLHLLNCPLPCPLQFLIGAFGYLSWTYLYLSRGIRLLVQYRSNEVRSLVHEKVTTVQENQPDFVTHPFMAYYLVFLVLIWGKQVLDRRPLTERDMNMLCSIIDTMMPERFYINTTVIFTLVVMVVQVIIDASFGLLNNGDAVLCSEQFNGQPR
jgi:hypothetical protein